MTTKLNDLQLILLSTACQREDGHLLPLPEAAASKPGESKKALTSLLKKGLASEVHTKDPAQQFREDGEWRIGLVITETGLNAIGADAGTEKKKSSQGTPKQSSSAPRKTREGTKQQLVIDLLKRKGGASIQDLISATGWLPHTTRAALTGVKKRGFVIAKEKVEGVTRYSIAPGDTK